MYFSPDGKSAIVGRRGLQAPRLPRPGHHGAAEVDRDAELLGITTASSPSTGSGRSSPASSRAAREDDSTARWSPTSSSPGRHAPGHPDLTRRFHAVRRRDGAQRGLRRRPRGVHRETAFIPTGTGAHGLYPSRDAKVLYVANRGSTRVGDRRAGRAACRSSTGGTGTRSSATWPVPVVQPRHGRGERPTDRSSGSRVATTTRSTAIDTTTGEYSVIPVGREPHGLAGLAPQPRPILPSRPTPRTCASAAMETALTDASTRLHVRGVTDAASGACAPTAARWSTRGCGGRPARSRSPSTSRSMNVTQRRRPQDD